MNYIWYKHPIGRYRNELKPFRYAVVMCARKFRYCTPGHFKMYFLEQLFYLEQLEDVESYKLLRETNPHNNFNIVKSGGVWVAERGFTREVKK